MVDKTKIMLSQLQTKVELKSELSLATKHREISFKGGSNWKMGWAIKSTLSANIKNKKSMLIKERIMRQNTTIDEKNLN